MMNLPVSLFATMTDFEGMALTLIREACHQYIKYFIFIRQTY